MRSPYLYRHGGNKMAEERDNGRARQARLEMTLAGADITKDIAPSSYPSPTRTTAAERPT